MRGNADRLPLACPTEGQTCQAGLCPDGESAPQPSTSWCDPPPTEPPQSGLGFLHKSENSDSFVNF